MISGVSMLCQVRVLYALTSGKQVSFAQWSTDGMHVDYLDALSSGVGIFHVVDISTGVDSLIATGSRQ